MPRRTSICRLWYVALIALLPVALLSTTRPVGAQDVVVLQAEAGAATSRTVSGEILDYTGRELRIRLVTGRERKIKPELIQSIETARCPQHVAGERLFAEGDFRAAEAKYREAVEANRESRPWVRRQILAQIVWCYQSLGQSEQAGQVFLMLVERDPDTPYFDCIPLAWTSAQPPPALEARARAWLAATDRPIAALLGASHLLDTEQRPAALRQLRSLTRQDRPRIAWLAQTQIWRVEAVQASPEALRRWSRQVDQSDEQLRAGPHFVLGSALVGHDPRAAAIALLEVPIMYPRQRRLAAAALLAAGGCLETTGATSEAARLYREIVDQHATAVETGEAGRRLDQLARPY